VFPNGFEEFKDDPPNKEFPEGGMLDGGSYPFAPKMFPNY
jgi:hypothetical protein